MATDKSAASMKPGKNPARPQATAQSGGDGFFQKSGKYLGEVRTELKKTTWPTRSEVIAQTQVVLALLIVIGVFIATWDWLLGQIFKGLLTLMGVSPRG